MRDKIVETIASIIESGNSRGCPGGCVGKKRECYKVATKVYNALRSYFEYDGETRAATLIYIFVRSFLDRTGLEPIRNTITDFIKENFKLEV